MKISLAALTAITLLALACIPDSWADTHDADGKAPTVLITGANRGIGLEFARQYANDGWIVIGTARKPGGAEELQATGARVVQLDVLDQDSVAAMANLLEGKAIDLLINNAGIFPRESSIQNVDLDDYSRTLAVNTIGPVRVTQALLDNLRQGDKKQIVNMSSALGSIGDNSRGGFYGYRESKAALNMFSKTLAAELGPEGFTCLAIHPGWVATDMGGPNATQTAAQSVSAMKTVLDGLTAEDNGSYRSYTGEQVAW